MSDIINDLLGKVSALTQTVNQIISNSKSVPELPAQTNLDANSLLPVSRGGNSEKISVQQIINAVINNEKDQLLSVGSISLLGNDLTISSISGKINNTVQTISTPTTINIPYCSIGLSRIDLIVYNSSNAIIRISGLETAGSIIVAPTLPLGALLVTQVSVSDSTIGDPSSPVLGASSYKGEVNLSGPTLVNGSGTTGDFFKIIQSGNYDFGSGNIYLYGGDFIYYDGASYDLFISNNQLELNKFPAASLPLAPTDLVLVNQGGIWKKVNKSDIGGGSSSSSQYVRMFTPLWDEYVASLNTWRSWAKNSSNILNGNANVSLGTGAVPSSSLVDCNFFVVNGASTLSELIFVADNGFSSKTYEIFVQSFTFANGTDVAFETNKQTLVQQVVTTSSANKYTRIPLSVATNTLDSVTGIKVAWRHTGGGGAYILQAVQMLFKFD